MKTNYFFDVHKTSSGHGCGSPVDLIIAKIIQAPGRERNPLY